MFDDGRRKNLKYLVGAHVTTGADFGTSLDTYSIHVYLHVSYKLREL